MGFQILLKLGVLIKSSVFCCSTCITLNAFAALLPRFCELKLQVFSGRYDLAVDMWSCGVLMYLLPLGKLGGISELEVGVAKVAR